MLATREGGIGVSKPSGIYESAENFCNLGGCAAEKEQDGLLSNGNFSFTFSFGPSAIVGLYASDLLDGECIVNL